MIKHIAQTALLCLLSLSAASAFAEERDACADGPFMEFLDRFMESADMQQKHLADGGLYIIYPEPPPIDLRRLGDLAEFYSYDDAITEKRRFKQNEFPIIPNRTYIEKHGLKMAVRGSKKIATQAFTAMMTEGARRYCTGRNRPLRPIRLAGPPTGLRVADSLTNTGLCEPLYTGLRY